MTPEKKAVHRFGVMFGEPRTPDPEMFLVEFEKAIYGFSAETLSKAVDRVLRTATFWPKPAEVREAAAFVLEEQASRNLHIKALDEREKAWKKPSKEEMQRVAELMAKLDLKLKDVGNASIDLNAVDRKNMAIAAQRPGFEAMQRASLNNHIHMKKGS